MGIGGPLADVLDESAVLAIRLRETRSVRKVIDLLSATSPRSA